MDRGTGKDKRDMFGKGKDMDKKMKEWKDKVAGVGSEEEIMGVS